MTAQRGRHAEHPRGRLLVAAEAAGASGGGDAAAVARPPLRAVLAEEAQVGRNHGHDSPRPRQCHKVGVRPQLVHRDRSPVHVVRNGFQPGCRYVDAIKYSNRLKITYTGTIYPDHQSLLPILDALVIVRGQNIDICREFELNLFGTNLTYLDKDISERRLEGVVFQRERLPRSEIRRIQQNSDILLLLNWETSGDYGIFPLKFLEYLDARRPILATGKSADIEIANILQKTKAGISIATAPKIAKYFLEVCLEFKKSGKVTHKGIESEILRYSYENSSSQLETILQKLVLDPDNK